MDAIALDQQLSQPVAERLGRTGQLLIDGKFVPAASGKTFPVYNPATGTVISNVAEGDAEDVNRAVAAARRAFEGKKWSRISPSMRGRLLIPSATWAAGPPRSPVAPLTSPYRASG